MNLDLTIEHKSNNTIVRDEEGDVMFVIPGTHDVKFVEAIGHIWAEGFSRGFEAGKREVASKLRSLLNVDEREVQS